MNKTTTKYVLRTKGSILAMGDDLIHYHGSGFGSGDAGLVDAKLWDSKRGLNQTNEVKHWGYEIVAVKVTIDIQLEEVNND